MSKILVVDDDPLLHRIFDAALTVEGHQVLHAPDGKQGLEALAHEDADLVITDFMMPEMDGVEFLERLRREHPNLNCIMMTAHGTPDAVIGALRERVVDFLLKPFTVTELRGAVAGALKSTPSLAIKVVSARPNWLHLLLPCDLGAVPLLQKLLLQLKADLPSDTREAIAYAFREMLNNAIEHGGKLDPAKQVEVIYVRLARAIIYWIRDPGEGFDLSQLEHAAVNNPSGEPFRHVFVRDEMGLRAGGFGILLTNELVDELVYNERRNEVMFIKYL
jgi:CheY-like chemotaxis protein